jgi:3',5'-cyclic AMP phosphodiesterase CpdA
MFLKRQSEFFFFVLMLGGLVGCVARSGVGTRFQESSRLVGPSLNITGVDTGNFTFSMVGDVHMSGTDTSRLRTILQEAQSASDAFIVFLGDMIDKGVRADFENFKSQVSEFGFDGKAIYILGNHDVFEDGWSAFRDLMGPSHFDVTVGNIRFLALDSADGVIGQEQKSWLEAKLKEPSPTHTMVLSHYMPLVPGQRTYLRLADEFEALNLMKLVSRLGVEAWLGAHYHSYIQEKVENVTYLVAGGGGGRRMEPLPQFFYVRATVQGAQIDFVPHLF